MLFEGNIYLIGFMGAGKSTVGRLLAEKMQWGFADTDIELSGRLNMPVQKIFNCRGEAFFRGEELKELQYLAKKQGKIVACGGGLPVIPGAIEIMKHSGIVVFLDILLESIMKRVTAEEALERPLWRNYAALAKLYHERMPFYLQADIIVSAELSPEKTTASVENALAALKLI